MAITLSPSGLTYVEGTDVESDFPAVDEANKTILNAAVFWRSGTLASRPTASSVPPGTHYYATDTGQLFLSTGSVWLVDPAASLTYTSLSLASGITAITGEYTPSARVEGDRVVLRGSVTNTSGGSIAAAATIFTLPSGMRPSASGLVYMPTQFAQTATVSPAMLAVASSGAVATISSFGSPGVVLPLNGLSFSLI